MTTQGVAQPSPWPPASGIAASATVSADDASTRRQISRVAREEALRESRKIWDRQAVFLEAPSASGVKRPRYCSVVPGAPSHLLLWIAPDIAICADGGHGNLVWELVFDQGQKAHRLRPNPHHLSRRLAIALFWLLSDESGV